MRRNFAQVLKSGKIDLKNEYTKLYRLFYAKDNRDHISLSDLISANFEKFHFAGTCLDLDEFDEMYGFHFDMHPQDFDIDYLVLFCEYVYNFVANFDGRFFRDQFNQHFYMQHIGKIIEGIGYMHATENGLTIFVPRDNAAIAVSESNLIPEDLSYKVIAYNHHSVKGDLGTKKQTLLLFADLLEPKRSTLEKADKNLASDLFFAFNNLNIRHNNVDPSCPKFKQPVADLTADQLEQWYDEVYQICLLAFMQLEHENRKVKLCSLKSQLGSQK